MAYVARRRTALRLRGNRSVLAAALLTFASGTGAITFNDVPPSDAISVLVKAPDGHVVRTLVANRRESKKQAGTIVVEWDGLDDAGHPVARGTYTATLVGNSIRYVWEGTIGNTSRDAAVGGEHIYRSLLPVRQIAVDKNGNGFLVVGYNEQSLHFRRFSMSDPNYPTQYLFEDSARTFDFVDTDGVMAYYANVGTACSGPENDGTTSFVAATLLSNNQLYAWSGDAKKVGGGPGSWGTWLGVDVEANTPAADCAGPDNLSNPSRWRRAPNGGVAVQRRGPDLFVAHTDEDAIHVLDKTTGRLEARIAVPAPVSICTQNDNSLWVLSAPTGAPRLLHFDGPPWHLIGSLDSGFQIPLAIGCNPSDRSIAVVDAGTMQVRDFDPSGVVKWTLGALGGHRTAAPEVRDDRFGFIPGFAYIAFLPDGSFWLGDPFNLRNLYFSSEGRALVNRIAYLPATYVVSVDRSEPQRVFAQFLEYSVDYSKPASQAWTLVRNWKSGASSTYVPPDVTNIVAGIRRPYLLPNGRTYAAVFNFTENTKELVELDPVAGLRPTGIFLPYSAQMYAGGSIRYSSGYLGNCGNPCLIFERTLKGFDDQNNPEWGPAQAIAQVPGVEGVDPVHAAREASYLSEPVYPETGEHKIVSFTAGRATGFHLGAVTRGGNRWDWRASPSGQFHTVPGPLGTRAIANDGSAFPLDNSGLGLPQPLPRMDYAGGTVDAEGHLIVFSYPGEGWNGAQASQFMLYDESGAMLGQFGSAGYPIINKTWAVPGYAGNPYCVNLITVDGKTYVYINDEAGSGGVQRVRLDGLDSIVRIDVAARID